MVPALDCCHRTHQLLSLVAPRSGALGSHRGRHGAIGQEQRARWGQSARWGPMVASLVVDPARREIARTEFPLRALAAKPHRDPLSGAPVYPRPPPFAPGWKNNEKLRLISTPPLPALISLARRPFLPSSLSSLSLQPRFTRFNPALTSVVHSFTEHPTRSPNLKTNSLYFPNPPKLKEISQDAFLRRCRFPPGRRHRRVHRLHH